MTGEPFIRVPFLDLKSITEKYRDEIQNAVLELCKLYWDKTLYRSGERSGCINLDSQSI